LLPPKRVMAAPSRTTWNEPNSLSVIAVMGMPS
jgi:hypothetical protein